ncbi:hypothetical protein [Paenibacillus gorillae]|uniref:hypothetical protein n=1 Tax=Paenibacillus gorillae TaxID=1243662 RepID=UPI0004B22AB2|nr:hypothetical protein [Paenibacillus gorillae]
MANLPRGWSITTVIVVILFAIGLLDSFTSNPAAYLIPIVVLGGIFLLYKFPPSSWGRGANPKQPYVKQNRTQTRQKPKSRTVPFRVINGGKDDDDTPKYH